MCEEEKASLQREKRAKRAARLSRLLTMVSDTSSVSVERAELMLLVKKGVDGRDTPTASSRGGARATKSPPTKARSTISPPRWTPRPSACTNSPIKSAPASIRCSKTRARI